MIEIAAALSGAALFGGVVLGIWALQPRPERTGPRRRLTSRRTKLSRGRLLLLVAGVVLGLVLAMVSGWLVLIVAVPAAALALPALFDDTNRRRIVQLDALQEWTRSLSNVLTIGTGLEQAIIGTVRTSPAPLQKPLHRLGARLRGRWRTEEALRAFADELDRSVADVGDFVVASLISANRLGSGGVTTMLTQLADSVTERVRANQQIEDDRVKVTTTTRWVTLITAGMVLALSLVGTWNEPYRGFPGQLILTALLALYGLVLWWMRRMVRAPEPARLYGEAARAGVVR